MPEDRPLEARVRARLSGLDADGLTRSLKPPSGIDLCSNDYLGLARHPAIAARLAAAAVREGVGSTGSRLLRGDRQAFHAIESRFARFKRAERAIYFGAGYLANLAVMSTLTEPGDVIFSDERNHASLIDGMRLAKARTVIFAHSQPKDLRRLIEQTPCSGVRFIVTESIFSMDGDMAPLAEYFALAHEAKATLVVDEAHAVGIYGAKGSGVLEELDVPHDRCLSISTGGKALGVNGAFVAGPSWAIDYLVQRGRSFVFSTAPPPALAHALDASLTIVEEEPERRARLRSLAGHLRARLRASGVDVPSADSPIVPVIIGDNEQTVAVAARLQQSGFDIRAIRPPSVPPGTARLRISVNAGLDEATLDRFAEALIAALKEMGLCAVSL